MKSSNRKFIIASLFIVGSPICYLLGYIDFQFIFVGLLGGVASLWGGFVERKRGQ